MRPETLSRAVALTGVGWGAMLLARGPAIWRAVEGSDPTGADAAAIKFLAARHLGQGLAQAAFPGHLRAAWLAVDLLHAGTMVLLAVRDSDRRRAALVTGGVALLSGLSTAISLAPNDDDAR